LKVLVACEYSGTVRDSFSNLGHDAWSCDLLETDVPGNHYKGNVIDIINDGWDLMIAHPPCTYLTNSGVCHLHKDPRRWIDLFDAADFFKSLLNANIPKIAIENPIMHKYGKKLIGVNQSQVIQPWMFGHTEQKATCLWLKNLPLLNETNNVKDKMMLLSKKERQRLYHLPSSKDRWKIRSITFKGIANAMAEQWGKNITKEAMQWK
jgi:hypothetical protein|tara:strand:+ start:11211 stop:11831 length:621 start_codon:yes stop_codon:yes gene_type:complete